ncbi:Histone H2A-IV [Pseudolycoriella hygida]|uniref:Histone H2A n=1 Tax=Pseudolycoriella hygida TaxID=35572 RepID=A0A9Q0MZ33_9DIPT|nr:Histone H2A-IV [Pseudolycoriella hygida]
MSRDMSKKAQTKSQRANLSMSVASIERNLRKYSRPKRVSPLAAVYTAAVLEYLCIEVLDSAGAVSTQNKRKRIVPRHIMLAIEKDAELKELLGNVTIPYSGIMPKIHSVPSTKRSKNKAALSNASPNEAFYSQEI